VLCELHAPAVEGHFEADDEDALVQLPSAIAQRMLPRNLRSRWVLAIWTSDCRMPCVEGAEEGGGRGVTVSCDAGAQFPASGGESHLGERAFAIVIRRPVEVICTQTITYTTCPRTGAAAEEGRGRGKTHLPEQPPNSTSRQKSIVFRA